MAWTTPGTAVAGDVLTAAFWNSNVRDNLNNLNTAGANSTGLVLIDSTSFTNSASIIPGSAVFSSTYESYMLVITGVSNDTSTRACYIRMRSGSTSASGADYYIAFPGRESSNADASTAAAAQTSAYVGVFSRSSYSSSMIITISNPYTSTLTTGTSIHGFWEHSNSRWYTRIGAFHHGLGTSYDRFELLPTSGSTGTVRTYGFRN